MKFDTWLMTLLEEKGIDLGEYVNDFLQIGDVVQFILLAPDHEQKAIKNVIVNLDFKNQRIDKYLVHLSAAITPDMKKDLDEKILNGSL